MSASDRPAPPIRTAAEVRDLAPPGLLAARREARLDETLHAVWQRFLDQGGPVPIDDVVRALAPRGSADVRASIAALDADDLLVVDRDAIQLAYPFASGPNVFAVDVAGVTRYACCAVDALGLAPMLGEAITVRARCHHCAEPFVIDVDPAGARSQAEAMVWVAPREACGGRLSSGL
jgi:hypothetical protein